MSSSILQAIWPGEGHKSVREFHNSHGTASLVWGDFCKRYLHESGFWWLLHGGDECFALWDLWKDTSIPRSHRAVLLFTLDNVYVKRQDYRRFAQDLRSYLSETVISANVVNHWPLIAGFFEQNPDYPAIGLWSTTVVNDPYLGSLNEDTEEYDPFDWSKSCDLYIELDAIKSETIHVS